MEIISYNIQFGRGLDGRFDLGRICESVKGADIICLQEVEAGRQYPTIEEIRIALGDAVTIEQYLP